MCRWAAYIGPDVFLEEIVTSPCHSLIAQSHHALEAKTATNGDGFGVAWYGSRNHPGLYRDILPAWSDPNLKSLCHQISARLFMAHVRAATGGGISRDNCHPFTSGRWSFMHNGQISGFEALRRPLEAHLPDEFYAQKQGNTDSELLFLLMLAQGLEDDPRAALCRTIDLVEATALAQGMATILKLTAAFSNGEALFAIRYSTEGNAPTLYHSRRSNGGMTLVSEPLDHEHCNWQPIPNSSLVTLKGQDVRIEPLHSAPIGKVKARQLAPV